MHRSLLVLAGLVPSLCGASVLRPRDRQAGVPDDGAPAPPRITTAPVVHVRGLPGILRGIHDVDRRAAADSVPACAAPCIESALTDDTTCSAHDLACGCKYQNAVAIETAASSCVESACGYLGAFSAWVTLESICATYAYTDAFTNGYTVPGGTATVAKTNGGGATKTAPGGSGAGATTTVTAGAGSSGSGSASGSGSGSDTGSVSSSSNGLSKGAIAGIAVGAAVGAIALCAVLFLVYRYTKRNNALSADGAAAATTSAPSHPPAGGPSGNGSATNANAGPLGAAAVPVSGATAAVAAAIPAGQNELDGKSSAVVSTVGSTPTPPRPSASPSSPASVPTVGQTPTPQLYDQNGVPLDAAAVAAWQQQQQQQQQHQQQQYAQQYAQQHPQYGAAAAQPYLVQGYSIAPGQAPQPQTVVAPAGYAAAHPSLPVPGVVYQEAPAGIPQAQYPHELPGQGAGAGAADMASPVPQHVVPVAVGPSAALPVAAAPSTATPIHEAPTPPQA
ncbi:hypothetical protein HMPREF1624_06898 [Sporothrix schenckii ATCC 58251]|uniref:CFEM domain-containing protein n=1 Tax=Sporothrix schenckii (strain ATCC 58251 / de Perez 2211183) TaxID=1391915 RepID=U7PPL3_SPOS1|nr:hypothetical protein HMPREF1624_06898 [Sporothrix schenckii ATCC 58251]